MRILFPAILALACLSQPSCEQWRFAKPVSDLSIRTPGTWAAASSGNEARISTGWLDEFHDPGLKQCVREALANNRDLKSASARLREAKEANIATRARLLPSLGLSGSSSRADSGAPNYGLTLTSSWEPDLWGRLRDLTRASSADYHAAKEDFRGARLSLAANTAKAWCNLVSAEKDLTLATTTLASYEKNSRIIERTYKGTGDGALDVQFSRTNVAAAKRAVESQRTARDEAARTLELLLSRYPSGTHKAGQDLPALPSRVRAGLPASLLDRRPDLAAARARLFASASRAEAARKNLLPDFSLTASSGLASARLTDVLDINKLTSLVVARFTQVLTEGGATSAEARAALDRNEALLHSYAQLALGAFREVEAALAAESSLARQEAYLATEVAQANLAEKQAERDYAEGINANILSVLEAQRRANNARASMIRLQNQRLQNRINLHLALGGDVQTRL